MNSLFTQSPIEASLWTHFVSLQQWIATTFLNTALFRMAVATWLGFVLMRCIWGMTADQTPALAARRFFTALLTSMVGLSLLSTNAPQTFRPVNATGKDWSSSARVQATGKYSGLGSSANGLFFYVQLHTAANEISRQLSAHVAGAFGDEGYSKSPLMLAQAMAQTAGAAIDDPAVVTSLQTLFENCADMRVAPVLSNTSSFSSLFDVSKPHCREEVNALRGHLFTWADGKEGANWIDAGTLGVNKLGVSLGLADKETYRNKVIASALVGYVRARAGDNNSQGLNTAGLLEPGSGHPMENLGQSYFVNLAHTLSVGGLLNSTLRSFTGTNYRIADTRNEVAFVYSKLADFLPPLRGYAKGILALTFVFAAAALCFGVTRFAFSWLGLLLVFTAYEPLSTLLYQSTMLFASAKENVESMAALRADPLVLAGAAIVDANIAGIQGVYFVLQIGLTMICGWAGMRVFLANRLLQSSGLGGAIVARFRALVPRR
jgi:hypothetical protein